MKQKLKQITLIILVMLVIVGCSSDFAEENNESSMLVAIDIPEQLIESVIDQITVEQIEVEVLDSSDEVVEDKTKDISDLNQIGVEFSDLESGTYQLQVIAIDDKGYKVFSGQEDEVVVTSNSPTRVEVEMEIAKAQLELEIENLPDDFSSGEVVVLAFETEEVEINNNAKALFEDLMPNPYYLKAIIDGVEYQGDEEFYLLPGRTERFEAGLNESDKTLEFDYEAPEPEPEPEPEPRPGMPEIPESKTNPTIYQAFYWESYSGLWSDIADKDYEYVDAEHLADVGVTSMWLPPAAKAGSGDDSVGYDVYDFWDLGEFDQQGAQATHWGTRDELESALEQLDDLGIDAYFDVVFNHRMGGEIEEVPLEGDDRTVRPFTDMTMQGRQNHYSQGSDWSWNWEEFNGADWCSDQPADNHPRGEEGVGGFINPNWNHTDDDGNPQSGRPALFQGKWWDNAYGGSDADHAYLMGNDVDYGQERVRNEMDEWGEWIINEVGFNGFRMDAIKHVDGDFVREWINHVQDNTDEDIFFVGEAWEQGADSLAGYLDHVNHSDMKVFDFPLRNEFVSLSGGGHNMNDWGGLLNNYRYSDRAVTFIDNHDTSREGNPYGQPQVENFKNQAYAYILMHEGGIPTVYARDYDEFGMNPTLDKLIEARRYFAYGNGYDVRGRDDVFAYVREGLSDVEGTGLVMLLSGRDHGGQVEKWINSGQPNTEFYDYTGNIEGTVTTNENGYANFRVNLTEDDGWSIWVPVIEE